MDSKSWYLSKTIWGVIIMAIGALLKLLGWVDISPEEQANLVDKIVNFIPYIVELIGAILAIIGRLKAEKPIA